MLVGVVGAIVGAPAAAAAQEQPGEIVTGNIPGTDGQWQYGEAVVAAPPAVVQHWLTDVAGWPRRFPDVESVELLGHSADGRRVARFQSSLVGRPITLHVSDRPGAIEYDGEGKNVTTHGRIFVQKIDAKRTRVIMQTTADVHGLAGWFATKGMKRERAERKIRSDLESLNRLAVTYGLTATQKQSR
jgi:carbon monoxide dehydrogenase subunit G